MGRARVLARNIFSSWTGFAVHVVVTLVLTPYILDSLGDIRYGVWALLASLTGYYGLLDLGFRAGLTQYLARYLATRDFERLNATASTGFTVLSSIGLFFLLPTSLLIAALAPTIFKKIPTELMNETRVCILIVGASAALQFVFFLFSAVFSATQRYDLINVIGISTRICSAALSFLLLYQGFGLIALCAGMAATNLLDYFLRLFLSRRILPELKISIRQTNWESCKEVLTFSLWNVVIVASKQLILFTDVIIVIFFLGPAAAARYDVGVRVANGFILLLGPVSMVFFPELTRLDASSDARTLNRVYIDGCRLITSIALGAGIVAYFICESFYPLWVPKFYTGTSQLPGPHLIFQILIVAQVISYCQGVSRQYLLARREVKDLAYIFGIEALINIALSIILINWVGLIGVAISTACSAAIFHGLVLPIVVLRSSGISPATYLRKSWIRPLVANTVFLAGMIGAHRLVEPDWAADNWLAWIAYATMTLVAGIVINFVGVTSREEKKRFVFQPGKNLLLAARK